MIVAEPWATSAAGRAGLERSYASPVRRFLFVVIAVLPALLSAQEVRSGEEIVVERILIRPLYGRSADAPLVATLGLVTSAGALTATFFKNDLLAALSAAAVATILLTTGLFGTAEVRLMGERARAVYRASVGRPPHVELAVRLQGTADWTEVWQRFVLAAHELRLESVRLDVNAPAWHEAFLGRWNRRATNSLCEHDMWTLEVPVIGHGEVIGRLTVAGVRAFAPFAAQIAELCAAISDAEALATRAAPRLAPTSRLDRPAQTAPAAA